MSEQSEYFTVVFKGDVLYKTAVYTCNKCGRETICLTEPKACFFCYLAKTAPDAPAKRFNRSTRDGTEGAGEKDVAIRAALAAVREEERMACYQLALDWAETGDGYDIAAAIRARKTTHRPADGER